MPTSLRARWAAWALLLLLFGSTAPALQAQSLDQGPRCATPEPTEAEARSAYEAVRAWLQQHPTPPEGGVVTIPVAFHVIYSGGQGNVPESQIVDQIERFNIEFASFGYQFVLAVLDRTENAQWFVDAPNQEFAMKQALAVAPAHFLNVYTANLQGGLL